MYIYTGKYCPVNNAIVHPVTLCYIQEEIPVIRRRSLLQSTFIDF